MVVAAGIAFLTRPAPSERERTLQLADAIYPAPDKVTLTLADGTPAATRRAGRATDRRRGPRQLRHRRREIRSGAEIAERAGEAPLYNELSVPDGSKCLVTLEDGTRVWLNARSTLRYPVKFAAGERRVELSGEGLFDVTHDPEHPFVVEAGKATMTVRGTKFNVRDFDDEGMASTTLLEGCVEVGNRSGKVTLEPGMQSRTRGAAETLDVREVDPAAYTAWTEDKIAFYNADLEEVLADIRRWYRVEIRVNVDPAQYALTGKIPRDFSLAPGDRPAGGDHRPGIGDA